MDNKFESKSNWKRLGLTNKRELKSRIRDIFEKNDHQEQIRRLQCDKKAVEQKLDYLHARILGKNEW